MEKISRIIAGNARGTADLAHAAPVRPGTPSFGRPVGDSTGTAPRMSSTAARAAALHNAMVESNKAVSQERVLSRMSDDFFLSHARRPDEETALPPTGMQPPVEVAGRQASVVAPALAAVEDEEQEMAPPAPGEYVPRGSFVDVHA